MIKKDHAYQYIVIMCIKPTQQSLLLDTASPHLGKSSHTSFTARFSAKNHAVVALPKTANIHLYKFFSNITHCIFPPDSPYTVTNILLTDKDQ